MLNCWNPVVLTAGWASGAGRLSQGSGWYGSDSVAGSAGLNPAGQRLQAPTRWFYCCSSTWTGKQSVTQTIHIKRHTPSVSVCSDFTCLLLSVFYPRLLSAMGHCVTVSEIVLTGLWFGGLRESTALGVQWSRYCSGPVFLRKPTLQSGCHLYCGSYYDAWKIKKKKNMDKKALGVNSNSKICNNANQHLSDGIRISMKCDPFYIFSILFPSP